jgi:hypothetical protein
MVRKAGPLIVKAGIVIVVAGVWVCAGGLCRAELRSPSGLMQGSPTGIGRVGRIPSTCEMVSFHESPPAVGAVPRQRHRVCATFGSTPYRWHRRVLRSVLDHRWLMQVGGRLRQEQTGSYYR